MDLFQFFIEEEQRKGEFMEIIEDDSGSYIMNSKDLCLMPKLDKILEIGVESLKVEGRNKSEYYAGITARAYSNAIKSYYENPEKWNYQPFMEELNTIQNRGYTYGFFDGKLTHHGMSYESTRSDGDYRYAAVITGYNADGIILKIKNSFDISKELEFISPKQFETIKENISVMINLKNNEKIEKTNVSFEKILIPFENFTKYSKEQIQNLLPILSLVRMKIK